MEIHHVTASRHSKQRERAGIAESRSHSFEELKQLVSDNSAAQIPVLFRLYHLDQSADQQTSTTHITKPAKVALTDCDESRAMSILGIGTSSTVYLIDEGRAEKRFESSEDILNEGNIYRALGSHPRLLSIHHIGPNSIIMEWMKNGNLARYLQSRHEITQRRRHQWISQIAECFYLLHTHQISHCDSKLENFLLDDNYNIKICDFASSHNWKAPSKDLAIQPVRYRRAVDDFNEAIFNPADDIFAFGSICYEIITGGPPYAELDDENVKLLFSQGTFPKTKDLSLGHVIKNCWECHFMSFEAILSAIQREK